MIQASLKSMKSAVVPTINSILHSMVLPIFLSRLYLQGHFKDYGDFLGCFSYTGRGWVQESISIPWLGLPLYLLILLYGIPFVDSGIWNFLGYVKNGCLLSWLGNHGQNTKWYATPTNQV